MKIFRAANFAELYKKILFETINCPDNIVAPRGNKTYELNNVALELTNPYKNLFDNAVRAPSKKYLAGEMIWYFSGSKNVEFIKKYSAFWENIVNPDGTCNSAYGNLLFNELNEHGFTEWGWALESLKKDKNTRQAIIRFNKPRFSYSGNKDFVCTLVGHFVIRRETLYLSIMMRSNDLRFGIQYDIPFFTILHQIMRKQLLDIYPNLRLGTYTHLVNSIHVYEKDIVEAKKALKAEFVSQKCPRIENMLPVTAEGKSAEEYKNLARGVVNYNVKDRFYRWVVQESQIESELSKG